jgi:hypothetical protein
MEVTFQPDPASSGGLQYAATTAAGEAFFPVTADANGLIRYRVCAQYRPPVEAAGWVTLLYRVPGETCRSSVDAVVVSPAQVTLAPGASQVFTVVVQGAANQAVTWSVDGGGTISATGTFTSDGTTGTFSVRATSVEDPNAVGLAQVTVGSTHPPPPPPGGGPCQSTCQYSGTWTVCYGDGTCIKFASGDGSGMFADPWVSTRSSTLSWLCQGPLSGMVQVKLTLQPDGSFAGASPATYTCQFIAAVTGTATAQQLQLATGDGRYSFVGSRVP